MKKILKNWGIALLSALFVVCAAFMLMPAKTQVAEAASPTISLSQIAGGSWTWSDHATKVTIGQWNGSGFKRYTDNTLGVGYCFDSGSWVSTATLEYAVPSGQTIESFSLSITTTAAVRIQYSIYKKGNKNPYGYDYPDSGISAQSGNTYSVTNSVIYHRSTYKGTTLTGGDKITFSIYDGDVNNRGNTIYTGGKVARDGNIAVTSLSITLNNATYSVSIKAGTGIKETFLSTSSVATSGSASGTKYDVDSYVYGFVKLNAGYKKPNSANWTLIDGTANQENAIYRVAEQKVSSQNIDFGTINAEAKTKNLYKMDSKNTNKGYETLNWGQAKTIPAITKTGYNFVNYNTAVDGTGTTYGDSSGVSLTAAQVNAIIDSSISGFYAQWSAKTFDVTFDKRGGAGGDDGVTMTYDQPAPGTIAVPSKPGYIFQKYTATHPTNYSVIDVYNSNGEATSSKWQIDSDVRPIAVWYGKPYKAYIAAGTGVKSVYLSTSINATPDSDSAKPSGTSFTNGQYVHAYIVLERGYVPVGDWTLTSGDYYVGDGVFRKSVVVDIASDEEEYLQYDFGTINAELGNFAVGISAGTGVSTVKLSAKDDGTDLVDANSKFVFDSQVYAYATLSVGYKAQDGWTLIDGESNTAGALYLVDTIENIDIDSDFGAISAIPKQYTVTLEGLDDTITATYDAPLSAMEQLPTREGYDFVGYFDAQEGGNQYINADGSATDRIWNINDDEPMLYAHWTKTMDVVVTSFDGDYDGTAHTISIVVNDPETGAVIKYGTTEGVYDLDDAPTFTDVDGVHTIYYQITADVGGVLYTTVTGSATIVIKEVDKTALTVPLATDDAYYDLIKDDYSSIANDLKDIIDNIKNNIRDSANVTAAQVDQAVADLQTALSTAKVAVTEAKIDAIGSGNYSAEKAAKINEAREYYDNELTKDEQAAVTNYEDLQAAEALYGPVGEVVDEINALSAITDPQAFKEAVETARANYEALQDDEKAVFPNDTLAMLVDSEAIIPVVDKINAIGDSEDTQDFRDKVADARTDYSDLTSSQKDIFPDSVLKVLTDDETAIDVMDKINLIGTVAYTAESKSKIDTANAAYEALDASQKPLVANYDKLEQANTDYDKVNEVHNLIALLEPFEYSEDYKDALNDAREAYDALTPFQKSIVPADDLKELVDDEKAYDAMAKIDAIGTVTATDVCKDGIDTARGAYNALTDDQKARVGNYNDLTDAEAAYAVAVKIAEIDEIVTLDSKDGIDEARGAYNELTDDQKARVGNYGYLTDAEAALAVVDLIAGIDEVILPDDKDAIENARNAYNALTDDQKARVGNYEYLTDAEAALAVVDLIAGIDEVILPDDKDDIENARNAYDALTDDQKALVPEDVLKILIDNEKVVEFMDAVNAIGDPENTDDFRDAVEDARDIYDALSNDQKALVPEDTLKVFTDDETIVFVMDKINAIGDVEYTETSKALIDDARENFDDLSEDQKLLFPEGTLKVLTDAEKAYEFMDKSNAMGTPENTEEYMEKVKTARETYDMLTKDQKEIVTHSFVEDLENAEAVVITMGKVNAIGEIKYTKSSKELIEEARAAYEELTEEQKHLVPASVFMDLEKSEQLYETMEKNAGIISTVLIAVTGVLLAAGIVILILLLYKRRKDEEKEGENK